MNEALQTPRLASDHLDSRLSALPRELLQLVTAAEDRQAARRAILRCLVTSGLVCAATWLSREEGGELKVATTVPEELPSFYEEAFLATATSSAAEACRRGESWTECEDGSVIAAPIFRRGVLPEAVAVWVDPGGWAAAREALIIAATHATLADLLGDVHEVNQTVQATAAMLEILESIEQAEDLTIASGEIVDRLQSYLDCRNVALGLWRNGRSRLTAISRTQKFDRYSELASAIEAAQDEAILRQDTTVAPADDVEQRHAQRAHQRLAAITDAGCVMTVPLVNASEQTIGAVTLFAEDQRLTSPSQRCFVETLAPQAAQSIDLLMAARQFAFRRRLKEWVFQRKALWAVLVVAALTLAMLIPVTYRVKCDCELQPVVRRFIAAPYDAKLAKAMVGPGDVVENRQILARVDGREMRWELDEVLVDHDRARKEYDAALSKQNMADAQIAKLEMQRLELRQQLLEHRIANLEITSPVDGMVLSGDLERTEGAPLRIGETLFEIAPLDEMVVELAIPESEVTHVQLGDEVTVLLDAYPSERWTGRVETIRPRAELVDNESVFIAEVALANDDGRLRPGMKGSAKVETRPHPLGWNLFHQPWEAAIKTWHGL